MAKIPGSVRIPTPSLTSSDFGWDLVSLHIKLNNCNQSKKIIVSFQ